MPTYIPVGNHEVDSQSPIGETARALDAARQALTDGSVTFTSPEDTESLRVLSRAMDGLELLAGAEELSVEGLSIINPGINVRVRQQEVNAVLREIRVAAEAVQKEPSAAIRRIRDHTPALDHATDLFMDSIAFDLSGPDRVRRLQALQDRISARRFLEEAESARDRAVDASQTARRAAGVTGEVTLAEHYKTYATQETKRADQLSIIAVAIVLVIAALAVVLVSDITSPTVSEVLAKASVTLPLAALAAYLARESSRHRMNSRWAQEFTLQLLTFDAFTEPLSDDTREELRRALGQRLFTSGGPMLPGVEENHPSAIAESAGLLDSIARLLRREAEPQEPHK